MAKPLKFETQNHYRRHRRSKIWARVRVAFKILLGISIGFIALGLVVGAVAWLINGELP